MLIENLNYLSMYLRVLMHNNAQKTLSIKSILIDVLFYLHELLQMNVRFSIINWKKNY